MYKHTGGHSLSCPLVLKFTLRNVRIVRFLTFLTSFFCDFAAENVIFVWNLYTKNVIIQYATA